MTVHIYNEGDHPGQFQGIRVVRMVRGELKQRYFSFRERYGGEYYWITPAEEARRFQEAQRLDRAWAKQQERFASQQRHAAQPRRGGVRTTGVAGIVADWQIRKRADNVFIYPVFLVHGSHLRQLFYSTFGISQCGFDEGWEKAVTYYARQKELSRWRHLIRRKPDKAIFRRVRDYYDHYRELITPAKLRSYGF